MILNYKNFLNELNSKIITLYHGQKGYRGEKFKEFDFNIFPYFYLTPEYDYCFNYAVDKDAIHTFKVDTSNFVDLTDLDKCKNYTIFLKLFFDKTGVCFPAELRKNGPIDFWEIIRRDSKGYIKKRLLSKGINGFKMLEWYGNMKDKHVVYCLLNNDSIVKEIKESFKNKTISNRKI